MAQGSAIEGCFEVLSLALIWEEFPVNL